MKNMGLCPSMTNNIYDNRQKLSFSISQKKHWKKSKGLQDQGKIFSGRMKTKIDCLKN